jgi:hypothetical protein
MGTLPYSLSKAGIIQLTRIAAVELGIFGIRANAIAPGGIATGIFGQSAGASRNGSEKMAVMMKDLLGDMQAIRRAGLPEDIANAALFLASDDSSFISGITLLVDGGMLSGRIPQYPEENQAKWSEMMQKLDPEDQKILTQRAQEGMMKMMEDLKYMKPEIREKVTKRMQRMAQRRAEG